MPVTSSSGELIVVGVILILLGVVTGGSATLLGVGGLALAVGLYESRVAWQARGFGR